jgi:hypothetical protein
MKVWEPGLRDEAAIGLVRLLARPAWAGSDTATALRAALRKLADDLEPVVRAQASHGILLLDDDPGPTATVIGRVRDRILLEQDLNVLAVQLRQVAAVIPDESAGELDQFLEELAGQPQGAFLQPGAPGGEPPAASPWSPREEVAETVAEMLTRLAVVDGAPFSARRLADWLSRPLHDADRTKMLLRHLQPYLNPPDGTGQEATFTQLAAVVQAIRAAWPAVATPADGGPAGGSAARDAALIAHQLAQQLDRASGAHDHQSPATSTVPRGADPVFAAYAIPLLCDLGAVQHPQVTQPVIQALINLSQVSPAGALQAVAQTVPPSGPYVTDPVAASTVCAYLTRLLAEHRDLVLGTDAGLTAFRYLLEAFAGAGDPAALALVYAFAEAFR